MDDLAVEIRDLERDPQRQAITVIRFSRRTKMASVGVLAVRTVVALGFRRAAHWVGLGPIWPRFGPFNPLRLIEIKGLV